MAAGVDLLPTMESRPEDEELSDLLLKYSKLLIAFAETGSIPQAAAKLGLDVRAAQRKIQSINEAAVKLAGNSERPLINVQRGRNGITLTHHGLDMVKDLQPIVRDMQGAVARYARKSKYIDVTVTSACLKQFSLLTKSPDLARAGIRLLPAHRRTSDIHADIRRQRDTITPLAFYSVAEEERAPERGGAGPVLLPRGSAPLQIARQVLQVPFAQFEQVDFFGSRGSDKRSLWVLEADEFMLLAPKELSRRHGLGADDAEIEIEAVLEDKWVLLAPRYGAVAQFLEMNTPGYWRHGEVRDSTDFQTGINSLRLDLIPRDSIHGNDGGQVMVVHGLDLNRIASLKEQGYQLLHIKRGDRKRRIWALTGLFLDRTLVDACEDSEKQMWDAIWKCATEQVWPKPSSPQHSLRTA